MCKNVTISKKDYLSFDWYFYKIVWLYKNITLAGWQIYKNFEEIMVKINH